MMKLPELNRHIVGVSALALAILGLGYAANVMSVNYNRPVAQLESSQVRVSEADNGMPSNFLNMLSRIPPNVYGRASSGDEQAAKPQERAAVSPQGGSESSFFSEAKKWTEQDWRAAADAVANLKSSRGQQAQNYDMSGIVWAPPEEIASKNGAGATR
ncbi:MAG: hypothetical protein ACR652_18025 [Methylocystis sp.]|uniref:hypothetical protein n=1 Tax=Methylocystis sp. TaxID=1911079 RepID=UPI003DA69D65